MDDLVAELPRIVWVQHGINPDAGPACDQQQVLALRKMLLALDAQRRTGKIDSLRHLIKHGRRDAEGA